MFKDLWKSLPLPLKLYWLFCGVASVTFVVLGCIALLKLIARL
jgi:hypothetical protein